MDAASGCISNARELLAAQLANTTAFQGWSGVTWTVAEAREHVYQSALPEEGEDWDRLRDRKPFALIARPPEANRFKHVAGPNGVTHSGSLLVELHSAPLPLDNDDPGANVRAIENFLGALIISHDANAPGLMELSSRSGYLNISEIVVDGPIRVPADDIATVGDGYISFLLIQWGIDR